MKRIWFLLLLGLGLLLNSCLEAQVDIDLKRDGSGEMRMKILPLEVSLNSMVDLVEADLRNKQGYKDSDIEKGIESDGRKYLIVRKAFKDIKEADPNCSFTSYKEYDQFIMDIPGDFLGIVKTVRVKMPGQIIKSNKGNISGRSLVWHRTQPSDNRLVISSKPPLLGLPKEKELPLIIIVIFAIGVVIFLTVLTKIKRKKIAPEVIEFCPECGTKSFADDNFCRNCGQSLK